MSFAALELLSDTVEGGDLRMKHSQSGSVSETEPHCRSTISAASGSPAFRTDLHISLH